MRLTYNETKTFGNVSQPSASKWWRDVECPASYHIWFDAAFSDDAVGREVRLQLQLGPGAPNHSVDAAQTFRIAYAHNRQLAFDANLTTHNDSVFLVSVDVRWTPRSESVVHSTQWKCS